MTSASADAVAPERHYLQCRSCGRTVDVDCAPATLPCPEPSAAAGFLVDEAAVVFHGLCPDCQR